MGIHSSSSRKEDDVSVAESACAADQQKATKLFSIGSIIVVTACLHQEAKSPILESSNQ